VHNEILYYQVLAIEPPYTPYTIDYDTWPRQPVRYFAQRDPPLPLTAHYRGMTAEAAIVAGLEHVLRYLSQRYYTRDGGASVPLDLILVDAGFRPDEVGKAIRAVAAGTRILPSKGFGIGPGKRRISEWTHEPGTQVGRDWRKSYTKALGLITLEYDSNRWKSFTRDRIAAPKGEAGAWTIFGDEAKEHQLLFDHCCAQVPVQTEGPYGKVELWQPPPSKPDDHYWDNQFCAVLAANAIADGAKLPEWVRTPDGKGDSKQPRRKAVGYL
jgi:hypothetical protein